MIFGDPEAIAKALQNSSVSRAINTAFIERYNATDRHQNATKARRTYEFSKAWERHNEATKFVAYTYNFCWPVRTLRRKNANGNYQSVTPAMAANLTDHVWKLAEWLSIPVVQLN